MRKIITEHELATRSAGLREKLVQLERQQTDEGWFDDAVGGVKKFLGYGDKAPAEVKTAEPAVLLQPGSAEANAAGEIIKSRTVSRWAVPPGKTVIGKEDGVIYWADNSGRGNADNVSGRPMSMDMYNKGYNFVDKPLKDAIAGLGLEVVPYVRPAGLGFFARNRLAPDGSASITGAVPAVDLGNTGADMANAEKDANGAVKLPPADTNQVNTLDANGNVKLNEYASNKSVSYSNEQTLVRIVANLNEYIMLSEGTAAGIVPDGSILKANQLVWSPDSDNGKRFGGKDLEKLGDGRWCADGYCIFHKDYRAILDKIWFDKNSSPTTPTKAKTPAFEPGIDAKNTGSWDSKQIDYKGTVQAQAIQHANNIANVNSIVVGKTLDIPGVGTYKIAPGDTLDAIAAGRYKKPDNLQKSDSGIWNKGPDESDAEKQRNIRKNFNARDQSTRDQEERIHRMSQDREYRNGPDQHDAENNRLGMNETVGFQADEVTRIVSLIHYK